MIKFDHVHGILLFKGYGSLQSSSIEAVLGAGQKGKLQPPCRMWCCEDHLLC